MAELVALIRQAAAAGQRLELMLTNNFEKDRAPPCPAFKPALKL